MKAIKYIITTLLLLNAFIAIHAQGNPNAITGKWVVLPKENFIVDVYKDGNEYKARYRIKSKVDESGNLISQEKD